MSNYQRPQTRPLPLEHTAATVHDASYAVATVVRPSIDQKSKYAHLPRHRFACPVEFCEKDFSRLQTLRNHVERHHPDFFETEAFYDAIAQMKVKLEEKIVPCMDSRCNKMFNSTDTMQKHFVRKHKGKMRPPKFDAAIKVKVQPKTSSNSGKSSYNLDRNFPASPVPSGQQFPHPQLNMPLPGLNQVVSKFSSSGAEWTTQSISSQPVSQPGFQSPVHNPLPQSPQQSNRAYLLTILDPVQQQQYLFDPSSSTLPITPHDILLRPLSSPPQQQQQPPQHMPQQQISHPYQSSPQSHPPIPQAPASLPPLSFVFPGQQ